MMMGSTPAVMPHEVHVPEAARDGLPVLLLLHGRGADRHDLFDLHRHLPHGWTVVAPDAPFPGAPWGYGPGRAWYRYLGRNRPEPDSYSHSLHALDTLIAALPSIIGHAPGDLAIGGFSQGATTGLGYALSRPGTVRHVLNFSGFLADHPEVVPAPDRVDGTRFFWGHGEKDPSIPFALAEEGRDALRAAGADLEARDYDIGHWIDPDELADAMAWLRNV